MGFGEAGKTVLTRLMLSANVQEFAEQVEHLCDLLAQGELTELEVEQQIDHLFDRLEQSAKSLEIEVE